MADVNDLYQEVILDHAKAPRNYRALDVADHKAEGFNPLCGDRCTVFIAMDGDTIADVTFQGSGCAISVATASLMTETLVGKTRREAEELFERFHSMMMSNDTKSVPADLGKLEVLSGVKEFPSRIKCATLAWNTLLAALKEKKDSVSTE